MKYSKKALLLYLLFAFVPVWGGCALLMLGLMPNAQLIITPLFAMFMFMPAVSSLLTRLITKQGFTQMRLRPHFKGNLGVYAAAWFVPSLFTIVCAALFFFLEPQAFDATFGMLAAMGVTADQLTFVVVLQAATGVLLGPILNFIPCLGEELGWRAFLLPMLSERFSRPKATLLTGLIWGLWHAPMIALGHNYGTAYAGYPWLGILMMTIFCILFGTFLAAMTFRTDSVLPAALAHAWLNAIASLGMLFIVPDFPITPILGPLPVAAVGILPGLLFLLLLKRMNRWQSKPEPVEEA